MPDLKWLIRGAQSALFFYASCGPIYESRSRRKRRKQAKRDKQMKQKMREAQPDAYYHPAPFDMNPYWAEELALGPNPPPRRARNKNSRQGRSGTTNTQSTIGTTTSQTSRSTLSSPVKKIESLHLGGYSWGMGRYQRADEELMVVSDEEDENQQSGQNQGMQRRGSSIGLGGWPSKAKPSLDSYYVARAPPVNDLHPPIVSTFSSNAADNAWMKAPPPSAKFMNGHGSARARSNRSRSSTSTGNHTGESSGRSPVTKLQDPRTAKADFAPREHLSAEDPRVAGSVRQESRSAESLHLPAPPRNTHRRKRRPAPIRVSEDSSSDSDSDTPTHPIRPKPAYAPTKGAARAPRPQFKPTQQNPAPAPAPPAQAPPSANPHDAENKPPPHKQQQHHPDPQRPSPVVRDTSLNALQELVAPNALLTSTHSIKSPPADAREDVELMLQPSGKAVGGVDRRGRRDSIYGHWVGVPVGVSVRERRSVEF